MKINIFKEKNMVKFNIDDGQNKMMNFDNLVNLSKEIIKCLEDPMFTYTVEAEPELKLYEDTVSELIDSIKSDDELLDLLNQSKQEINE